MRLIDDSIPTTFTRLDEEVVAADTFVNVRTQQLMRQNFNALLGGSHMRTIFCDEWTFRTEDGYVELHEIPPEAWAGVDEPRMMTCIYSKPIYVSPMVRKLKCTLQAAARTTANNLKVYGAICIENETASTYASTQFNSGSGGYRQSIDLTVPVAQRLENGMSKLLLKLWFTFEAMGSDVLGTPAAISAVTDASVTATTASIAGIEYGDLLYFPGTSIEARIVQGKMTSGSSTTIYINPDNPWVENRPTTSDTIQAKDGNYLRLKSVQLAEYAPTGNFADLEAYI